MPPAAVQLLQVTADHPFPPDVCQLPHHPSVADATAAAESDDDDTDDDDAFDGELSHHPYPARGMLPAHVLLLPAAAACCAQQLHASLPTLAGVVVLTAPQLAWKHLTSLLMLL